MCACTYTDIYNYAETRALEVTLSKVQKAYGTVSAEERRQSFYCALLLLALGPIQLFFQSVIRMLYICMPVTCTSRPMLSLRKVSTVLFLMILKLCGVEKSCSLEIQAFQPAVVPSRAITTLTLKTSVELNVTSNTTLQCRFKDTSVPAWKEDGFVFCDTPPMKNTDRVPLYLDVDGKLFKTKKPLYLHEPFKVSNITPPVVSPAQNIHLTVSGISCQDWMQYFVRYQTANGTKKTQQGICKDSVITCCVPEFPPNTRLRVGLTLSNRLVQWADRKILIQYPIDAMKSSVKDVKTDTTAKGSFAFVVVLRDRFGNSIKLIKSDNKKQTRVLVQYSPRDKPKSMKFLECTTTLRSHGTGDEFMLNCAGAEKESIYFYPSINNVPLGGKERYEATTTLCPGKNSCKAQQKSPVLVIVLSACFGFVLLVLLAAVFMFVRRKKKTVALERTNELEMDVQLADDITHELVYQVENTAFETSVEEVAAVSPIHENASKDGRCGDESSALDLNDSGALEDSEQDQRTAQEEEEEEEVDAEKESNDKIEMQNENLEHGTEQSAAEAFEDNAGQSVLLPPDADSMSCHGTHVQEGSNNLQEVKPSVFNDGLSVSFSGQQFLDRARNQPIRAENRVAEITEFFQETVKPLPLIKENIQRDLTELTNIDRHG